MCMSIDDRKKKEDKKYYKTSCQLLVRFSFVIDKREETQKEKEKETTKE